MYKLGLGLGPGTGNEKVTNTLCGDAPSVGHVTGDMKRRESNVAGYGGLRLPFRGITDYLGGLVSMYERPIIAGVPKC